MNLDKKLHETEYIKTRSWGKLLTVLKKQFDQWVMDTLDERGYNDFKLAHMPFIMNIDPEGTNNNEMAKRARVTKQAMSKVAKELQELGYIESTVDLKDKRTIIFSLTERGKKFVIEARLCVKARMDEYRHAIGKQKFEQMLETMQAVVEYNDRTTKQHE